MDVNWGSLSKSQKCENAATGRDCGPRGRRKRATHDNPPSLSQHLGCIVRRFPEHGVHVDEDDMFADDVVEGDEDDEDLDDVVGLPVEALSLAVAPSKTLELEKDRSQTQTFV